MNIFIIRKTWISRFCCDWFAFHWPSLTALTRIRFACTPCRAQRRSPRWWCRRRPPPTPSTAYRPPWRWRWLRLRADSFGSRGGRYQLSAHLKGIPRRHQCRLLWIYHRPLNMSSWPPAASSPRHCAPPCRRGSETWRGQAAPRVWARRGRGQWVRCCSTYHEKYRCGHPCPGCGPSLFRGRACGLRSGARRWGLTYYFRHMSTSLWWPGSRRRWRSGLRCRRRRRCWRWSHSASNQRVQYRCPTPWICRWYPAVVDRTSGRLIGAGPRIFWRGLILLEGLSWGRSGRGRAYP